jgi:hypothetical protein
MIWFSWIVIPVMLVYLFSPSCWFFLVYCLLAMPRTFCSSLVVSFIGSAKLLLKLFCADDNIPSVTEIAAIAKNCLATVQEYDKNAKDFMSLSAAQMKFDDIVKSPSLEIASKKIGNLAKKGELDSSLMLLLSKAYSASKESTLMKEEVRFSIPVHCDTSPLTRCDVVNYAVGCRHEYFYCRVS